MTSNAMAVKMTNGKIPVHGPKGSGNSKTLNVGGGAKKSAPLVGKTGKKGK